MANPVLVYQSISVDTKALHHTKASWYTSIGHGPHEHMRSFGVQILEVPEIIMGALTLGNISIWLRFDSVH